MGPGGGMGGMAPPGAAPAAAAGPGGGDIGQMIAKMLADTQGDSQTKFVIQNVKNMKANAAVMVAKLDMSHPEVARHLSTAWRSLDAALKAAEKVEDNQKSVAGPPLGFSGAGMGQGQQPEGPMGGIAGAGQ